MEEKNVDQFKELKEIWMIAANIMVAVTLFIIMDFFFKMTSWGVYSVMEFSIPLTIIFGIVVFSLAFAVTKKTSRATAVCYIMIFILNAINLFKMIYTAEPIYFSDINFLGNIGEIASLATGKLSTKLILTIIGIFASYAAVLIAIYFGIRKVDVEIKSKKLRLGIIAIDLLILLILFMPNKYTKEFFLKTFFATDTYKDSQSYTTNRSYYNMHGFINGMYGIYLNNVFTEPKGYDDEKLNNQLSLAEVNTKKYGKPNVITVFSESMWDLSVVDEFKLNVDPMSEFKKLQEEGKGIKIISPSYGGMSENVAFEYLTGASMNYFTKGYIPIMSLYRRAGIENAPSVLKGFMNSGYSSEIIFANDYYDSEKTYNKIGFEKFSELVEKGESYISDDASMDEIIKRLETKGDKPLFCMLSTIEAHMPFTDERYEKYDVNIEKSSLSDNVNKVIKTYAQCIYNNDKAIKKLYDYIKEFDEPTILIVVSDHLPFLYTEDNNNVIDLLDYFKTEDELENYSRLYTTDGLIIANYDISGMEIPDILGADQVLNTVANQLDIKVDDYYKWLYNSQDTLVASNRYISIDKQGNRYETQSLENERKALYDDREHMQYKLFINTK